LFTVFNYINFRQLMWSEINVRDHGIRLAMDKPFHMMTPAERTAARIAKNRAIEEKVVGRKSQKPPVGSTGDYTRATPEEHASKLGGVVRKVQS
jgi:hypothetical protein